MNLFSFNPLAACALVIIPISLHASTARNENEDGSPGLRSGIVVDHLTEHFDAIKAGMRPGDVLLSWARGTIRRKIESPFDLIYIRYEQAARGTLRINGLRLGQRRSWSLGSDVWGIWGRPNFAGELLSKYQACKALPTKSTPEQVIACWRAAKVEGQRSSVTWLAPWLLTQAAQHFTNTQQWTASDSAYQEALDDAAKAGPIVRGEVLREWARAVNSRADLITAAGHYEQAIKEWKNVGAEPASVATPLLELGSVEFNQGHYDKAEDLWLQALTISKKLAPKSLGTTLAYGNLGALYQEKGDLAKSEEYYRRALANERKYLPGSAYIPHQLANMGTLARDRGDLAAAESYLQEALLTEKPFGLENALVADILDDLSDCFLDRGDLAKAEQFQRHALAIREKLLPQSLGVASSLASLGFILYRKHDLSQAEQYFQKALTIKRQLAPESPGIAVVLAGLGDVALDRGEASKAEDYFRDALSILDKAAPGSLKHGETLASLAQTLWRLGRIEASAEMYRQALRDLEGKSAQLRGIADSQSHFRARHTGCYREYVDLLLEQQNSEAAFESLEASRARTLIEMLSRSHIDVRRGDSDLQFIERSLIQSLNAKTQFRGRLFDQKHTDEQVSVLDQEISRLWDRYEETEKQIRAASPDYAALTQPQQLSIKDIQQLLDPNTLLLEYSLGEKRSHLWIVGEDSLRVFELPPALEIQKAARHVYERLVLAGRSRNAQKAHDTKVGREYDAAARQLSQMIIGPAQHLLGEKRLVIVSDGALQYIPFSALPVPDAVAKPVPLIANHEIVTLPSASVLAELRRQRLGRKGPIQRAAVLADPVFDPADVRVVASNTTPAPSLGLETSRDLVRATHDLGLIRNGTSHLSRLLYSRNEAEAIRAVYSPAKSMVALDFRASRDTAMSPALARYSIVHFATHGLLNSKHPELSGLVFSLVNDKGKPQNGFLTLQDVYNLTLPVDLVVLSGCETGLGEEVNGEGLIGLTRGFMYAGATRVIASFWSVSDMATAQLMAHFYQAMERDGMPPTAALRKAQLDMLRDKRWSSPYYWAAFQIQGDWK